ncbi:MAG: hypothetical protein LBS21_15675, partial [Clostridiales bacterium]|nr:hypothetical protein [Clostridiales bacterium]
MNCISYTDTTVQVGGEYYYKITSLDSAGVEGMFTASVMGIAAYDETLPLALAINPVTGTTIGTNT